MIRFQITSLQASEFSELFKLSDDELEKMGVKRMTADSKPGFPCRLSLQDAEIGEEVILLAYKHHQVNSPYQSIGPIFVRKNATAAALKVNEIPKMLEHRLLSVRAYDKNGMMKSAVVCEGAILKEVLTKIFGDLIIDYIHIHNAKPGCYNCMVHRVSC